MSFLFDPLKDFSGRRIGYARVSTRDQKIRSQCDWLLQANCQKIFADQGVSGSRASRPELDNMLDFLQEGDAVLVWRLDRLGRSVSHLADLLTLFDNKGIHFCSFTEGINTTTAGGKLTYHIFAAVAEFNRNLIIENTYAGLEAAKARGVRLGRPPALSVEEAAEAHHVIRQFKQDPDEIAAKLNVSRATLNRTFKRYGLDPV